jgi:ribose-phosphate pyrophosphokinase
MPDRAVLLALPGNEDATARLAGELEAEIGALEVRRFPDEESYVRIRSEVGGRKTVVVCTLDRPDEKLASLIFTAAVLRELGAASVGLVAPYLAYMRQDRRFQPGEAVTSTYFAQLLSGHFDWLVTVDPHLHRRSSLAEIYSIPAEAVHAAPLISAWVAREVAEPVFIGPDSESAQWVAAVAKDANAPFVVLEKERRGDRDVAVSVPEVERWRDHTPVLVDDIVSTARTMIETVGHLKRAGMRPPVCVAVHAVFAGGAYDDLRAAGAAAIATTDTIAHDSNRIEVAGLLAAGIRRLQAE